jgi:hypothetical protein
LSINSSCCARAAKTTGLSAFHNKGTNPVDLSYPGIADKKPENDHEYP